MAPSEKGLKPLMVTKTNGNKNKKKNGKGNENQKGNGISSKGVS